MGIATESVHFSNSKFAYAAENYYGLGDGSALANALASRGANR
jgi:hypothetical protein